MWLAFCSHSSRSTGPSGTGPRALRAQAGWCSAVNWQRRTHSGLVPLPARRGGLAVPDGAEPAEMVGVGQLAAPRLERGFLAVVPGEHVSDDGPGVAWLRP